MAAFARLGGYLAVVGPPALRITALNTNRYVFDPAKFRPKMTVTNTETEMAAGPTNAAPAPVVKSAPVVLSAVSGGQSAMPMMPNPGPPNFNFNYPQPTASDLLTVSPQMVTQYLRPDRSGVNTNSLDQPGVSVFVPAGQVFTPPAPQNAPESSAVYRSQ